ncbi:MULTISPECIES: HAL/PAL/TAL family ammonia-lyase [Chryseobacterium]|uniref:Histidine ammonia-lyase n=1 Tax=Chryseobacterium camelliae TaxID=1265445 RepID=A0ABU0TNW0_9FLAO|nr:MULTISPECIES: aromatic amino acid ammonia-lyase [Chryseobacterium]MDT3408208.1 histidine ammonia-lyase [Pseudacidovorax intermedius]MDQ1097938.1 histidine ammonia-lyase [Chryseobacterium camelliae]MDQ1101869.1 histidine ammonia-lyase [Chryseobacterium sp. SORGH_AS_1048]MDR6085309.1 histidine ammonia-lyase [Chryseobacterium sp. SORGH_AS_0909]MDR6129666.1 histidine ammonia-lyase [Chryseobacterium sp. SORGH_AS_1175]
MKINNFLELKDFQKIIIENENIELDDALLMRVEESFRFLKEFSKDKVIYGVNTGFGPMAQFKIGDADTHQLQYNLIRSHSSGIGNPLPADEVKACMLARMNTLSLGKSGVHHSVVELLKELINRDIIPLIFEHGGVGASGDLVQLAHLALVLIGEGEVFYKGQRKRTAEVFEAEGLQPIAVEIREGLALMNGTSVMSGIGAVNAFKAGRLTEISLQLSCAINEIVRAYDDHLSEALNATKRHYGQQKIAERMREHLADSKLIRKRADHLYTRFEEQEKIFKDKVQEYYSLRCVPQILGPVLDTLEYTEKVLENEINSANDNPIINVEDQHVYHGGNFHGDYVALEMDKLKIAVTKLTMLAERQLNYLLNAKINEILPPFVNLGRLGLNFGMQGVQFTATSTTAESQMLSNPMYIHSIPNNNDNQDIVSMGTNAAVICRKVIENAFEVLSIEAITIVQAIDYLGFQDQVSSSTKALYDEIRNIIPVFSDDMVMYPYLEEVKKYLKGM